MEEKKSKKPIIIGVAVILLVTLTLLGVTYAYYRTRIIGNQNDTSISVTSKTLELTYDDNNSRVTATGVEPGYSATKTFKVKNTGDETISAYFIYLEDFVNTFKRSEDWTYTLTCSATSGSCNGGNGTLPIGEKNLINNSISKGVTHTYTLKISYANSDEDQSVDMGKQLSFKVNIRSYESMNPFDDSSLLAYRALDNAAFGSYDTHFRVDPITVPGEEVSTKRDIALYSTANTSTQSVNDIIYYSDEVTYDSVGGVMLLNAKKAKYGDVYKDLVGKYYSSSDTYGVLKGHDLINKVTSTTSTQITYDIYEITLYESVEATLSIAEDEYGTSYYYRGNPEDNYVTFNNMCWRIVRIQGDGSVKIALADKNNPCSGASYSKTNEESGLIATNVEYGTSSSNTPDYNSGGSSSLKNALNTFFNGGTFTNTTSTSYTYTGFSDSIKAKIKNETWCLGDENEEARLSANNISFKCSGNTIVSQIGSLSADETIYAGLMLNTDYNFSPYILDNARYVDSVLTTNQANSTGAYYYGEWGGIYDLSVSDYGYSYPAVRPVVTLVSGIEVSSGVGTLSNPYVIS